MSKNKLLFSMMFSCFMLSTIMSFGQLTLTSDLPDYQPGSTATFTGTGFLPNESVKLRIKNLSQPCQTTSLDSSYAPFYITADANGSFVTTWTVCQCPGDSLRARATGMTTGLYVDLLFSDNNYVTLDFQQPQNDVASPFVLDWTNGILNATHTTYYEGMGVPQRLIVTGLTTTTGNAHFLKFKHMAIKGGKHAYDFLMSWDQAVATAIAIGGGTASNELQNLYSQACDGSTISATGQAACNALSTGYTAYPDFTNAMDGVGDVLPVPVAEYTDDRLACFEGLYGNRLLELTGNAPFTSASVTFDGFELSGGSDAYAVYTVNWVSASTDIMVRLAGHLAVSAGDCGYGAGKGAGSINGGDYHFKLEGVDGNSGSLDNQIMAGAVTPPPPICNVSSNPVSAQICSGNSATLSVSAIVSSGTPPYNYLWNTGATGSEIMVSPNSTTNYTVTVTDANLLTCSTVVTVTVSNFPLPVCNITGGDNSVTSGSSTNWCATTGMSSYTWSGPNGFNETTECVDVSEAGTYSVTIVNGNGCNSTCTRDLEVTINEPPVCEINPASASICPGSSTNLSVDASGGSGQLSYLWSTGETTVSINVSPLADTDYTVTVTDEVGLTCSSTASVNVYIVQDVIISATGNPQVCAPSCVLLTASGGSSYVWTPGGSTGTNLSACATGDYSVVGTDANLCTSASNVIHVTINTPPTVSVSANGPTTVCSPACVSLTASGATSYVWTPGNSTGSSLSACATGDYSVVGTDANLCTSASGSVHVTVNTPPTVSVSANGPTTVCSPACVSLSASGATSYVWTPGNATGSSLSACATGDYSVVGTDANLCTSASSSVHVTINTPPTVTVTANGPTTVCTPACVSLSASGATSYVWTPGNTTGSTKSACATGTYSVIGTGANSCTAASNSVQVTINPKPTCSLTAPASLPVCGMTSNSLTVSISGAYSTINWLLTSGNNTWAITNGNGTPTITYKAGSKGTSGTFTVTVTNTFGCSSSCTVTFGTNCVEYCSYTQGAYGSAGGKACDGITNTTTLLNQLITAANPLIMGYGTRKLTVYNTEISCLITKLPAGTTPYVLPGTATCATATGNTWINSNKFKSVLLGQVTALTLNIRHNPALGNLVLGGPYMSTYKATSCSNGSAIPGTKLVSSIPQNVLNYLGTNKSVNNLLLLANMALGQSLTGSGVPSLSDFNAACTAINQGFDGCRVLAGFGTSSGGLRLDATEELNIIESGSISVNAYPNPFSEKTTLEFSINNETAHAVINIYSLNGSKIATIFDENTESGKSYTVEFSGDELPNGIYFYRIMSGSDIVNGKIVLMK